MGKRNYRLKEAGRLRWILLVIIYISVPLETGWILNGAKAAGVSVLSADSEEFRRFQIKAEELVKREPFRESYFEELAYRMAYGDRRVPWAFKWQLAPEIRETYCEAYGAILQDMKCFPVAVDQTGSAALSFENSWGNARSYGGKRRHEGIDIMTSNNVPGYFTAVSMCDGIIEKMGWLELGGYRIGVRSKHGVYAYYAHLDHYREGLKAGDAVRAGEVIGYVGNSGYGPEGTKGKFDVHLHFGLYLDIEGKETSINPYELLRYLQKEL